MATCFDRWEKDPFFSAAEEVQESADRMESVYRRWIHEKRDVSNPAVEAKVISGDLRRELHTALGTAKWQLEELERVVRSSDEACSAGDETRTRHSQFVEAIGGQISTVENSLKESNLEKGEATMTWVQLDEGERDELALFLSATLPQRERVSVLLPIEEFEAQSNKMEKMVVGGVDYASSPCRSNVGCQPETKEERVQGHRRTASASADIEAWKISVANDDELPNRPPPKTTSFSCLTKAIESTSKMKWSKNGFRKWKGGDQLQDSETIPLRTNQLTQGFNACYEKSKSCLSNCGDDCYDKQLYGWLGVLHRQLQRSQYQIQYRRPIQMIMWVIAVLFLVVLFGLRAI